MNTSLAPLAGATRESARVVAVELGDKNQPPRLWVEVFAQSTCGSCSASSTCGQGVLQRWFARKSRCYPVACERSDVELLAVGQWVEVEIPEGTLTRASLLLFVLPLLAMLVGAALGDALFGHELAVGLGGLAAFFAGLWLVRRLESRDFFALSQPRLCPPAS